MVHNYIKRSLETVLRKAVSEFPAVVLTGLKDPEHAASGPMGGPIMETAPCWRKSSRPSPIGVRTLRSTSGELRPEQRWTL